MAKPVGKGSRLLEELAIRSMDPIFNQSDSRNDEVTGLLRKFLELKLAISELPLGPNSSKRLEDIPSMLS